MSVQNDLQIAARKLAESGTLLQSATVAHLQASNALETAIKRAIKDGLTSLKPDAFPVTEHRRHHRPGRPPKINNDPELQAFITARIDRMTFNQIASDVADHFPPERQARKSAIHAWWHRNKARK